jgi:spore maturation protein SpmA
MIAMGEGVFFPSWVRLLLVTLALAAFAFGIGFETAAHAQDAAAADVKAKLQSLVFPAFGIGVVWFGYLKITGQASMQLALTFLIGAAIAFGGGYLV